MSKTTTTSVIIKALNESAKDLLPAIVGNGLQKLAEEQSNELVRFVMNLLALKARTDGPEAVEDFSTVLVQLLSKEPDALSKITSMTAAELTALTDILQTADAADRALARKWATKTGVVVAQASKIAFSAILTSF